MEDYPLGQSPLLRDVIAHGTLANAGSVMARPQLPQWRQDLPQTLGPTAGTGLQAGMDLLDKLLAFGPSPLDAAGSGSGAIFGPIRTAAQKQAVRALWRADPDAVKAINVDPDILQLNVPSSVGGGAQRIGKEGNALGTYTDNRISIAPTTMKGLYPSGKKGASLPEVMLHEGQHFLNEPRIYDPFLMNPKESFNMAQRIFPFLTPGATTNALEGAAQNKLPQIALDEALAYLSGSMTRNPKLRGDVLYDALKVRPTGQRPVLTPETLDKAIGKARDASSTNLFQNILAEARNKLGIGPRQALPTSGSRLPSLTPEELLMYDKLPRAGRSFKSPEDIARAKAGEQLPALGSALPDIPRPTASAPENLGAFEGIRSKLGLPEREATFSKFSAGDKKGPAVLADLKKRWDAELVKMDVQPTTNDSYMASILNALGTALDASRGLRGHGLVDFRRGINPGSTRSLPADETVAILQHLNRTGALNKDLLSRAGGALPNSPSGQALFLDDSLWQRLQKFLEETE